MMPDYGSREDAGAGDFARSGAMGNGQPGMMPPQQTAMQAQSQAQQPMQVSDASQVGGSQPQRQFQAQPRQGNFDMAQVGALLNSPFVAPETKRMVIDQIQQQRAMQVQQAEQARAQAANDAALREAGLPTALSGNSVVLKGAVDQRYAKPEGATSDQRELEQANRERVAAGLPTLRMDEYKTQKARAGAASVSVDASQKAESAFSVETGKALAKRFDEMVGEGDAAAQNLEVVADLRKLGTGIGTGAYAVVQSYLGKLGVKTEGLSQIEAYNALIDRLTPQQRLPGSGATSDFDAKMFKGSLTSLMNTPEGNGLIVSSMERIIENRMARGDIALRVQTGELSQREGLAEIRKLQDQARDISTSARDFGKPKTTTTDGPGAPPQPGAAQPQQGQPTPAEIEAEMKRRGLR